MTARSPAANAIGAAAAAAGIRHVHVVAWRDLDDVEAGGSEIHAANVCREWAAAGLEITIRTSYAQGHPPDVVRDGYRVERRAGRYLVFPRAAASAVAGRQGRHDALVEIWNGMPFFAPLWSLKPRLTFVHHVHGSMWHTVLPPRLAAAGEVMERRLAPPLYRRSQIVTLSDSSKQELVDDLGFRKDRVAVVPPGIDGRFSPGGSRAGAPTVLAVGRLVPAKRFGGLIRAAAHARERVPDLRLEIVGEGMERRNIETVIDDVDGADWVTLVGRCDDAELVARYRSAWLLASASSHEGWGMSITEAAACGTPAVVTDIAGHRDAVAEGETGLRRPDVESLAPAIADLLLDDGRRHRMSAAAVERAERFTWGATATTLMDLLAAQVQPRRSR